MHEITHNKKAIAIALFAILLGGCKGGSGGSLGGDNGGVSPNPGPTPNPDPLPIVSKINIPSSISFIEPINGSETQYIQLTLSEALKSDLTLYITTSDINARSSGKFKNYIAKVSEPFTIVAGETQVKLPLSVSNNKYFENDVSLTYSISGPIRSDYTIERGQSVVTLSDIDGEPRISFEKLNRTLLEGESDTFSISVTHPSSLPISVTLEQSGTVNQNDFTDTLTPEKTVTILKDELSVAFDVTATKDDISEGAEKLVYTLTNPNNVTIDEQHKALTIYIPGDKRFNDTGFVTRYDGNNFNNANPQAEYPNQDADFGSDTDNPVDHTDGRYGFSYTKFDIHGNALPLNTTNFACVRDNTTGLYVENKTFFDFDSNFPGQWPPSKNKVKEERDKQKKDPDNYIYPDVFVMASEYWQHTDYFYTWYEPNNELNGGSLGAENDTMPEKVPFYTTCAIDELSGGDRRCDTAGYLSQMNRFSICGFTDWRLPTPAEMKSLVSFNVDNNDNNNRAFLKFIHGKTYFTSATNAERNGSAWCIDTISGQAKLCNKGSYNSVIAVSGGKE
ncbi:Lcl C-terminal domain-containing protein [Vibrio sp. 16]|uniref:Lcl C-terminal domain-containing protein n=1 Tax=Vibrio sp. 16 TaxID=391586 RepID=UPI002FF111B0